MGSPAQVAEAWRAAYAIGEARGEAAHRRGAKHLYGYAPTLAEMKHNHGMAAVSEWQVAELTGRAWLSTGVVADRPLDGDVEGGLSVRWTPRPDGCLLVHPEDANALRKVLVVGNSWPLRVVGWRPAAECKQRRWWREKSKRVRHAAYFVPQHELLSMDALIEDAPVDL